MECVAEWLGGHPDTRVNGTTRGGVMMMAMVDERPGVCLAHCEKKCSVLACVGQRERAKMRPHVLGMESE